MHQLINLDKENATKFWRHFEIGSCIFQHFHIKYVEQIPTSHSH